MADTPTVDLTTFQSKFEHVDDNKWSGKKNKGDYRTYSGVDMIPAIMGYNPNTGQQEYQSIGNVQTISYSIHTDMVPVRTLGQRKPKSFTRGQQLIAGSIIFTVFDSHSLYHYTSTSTIDRNSNMGQLPAFDLLIYFSNEYGYESILTIYGVRIGDEGQVHSIDDLYSENTTSFMAHDIDLLLPNGEHLAQNPGKYLLENDKAMREGDITDIVGVGALNPRIASQALYGKLGNPSGKGKS